MTAAASATRKARTVAQARAAAEARRLSGLIETGLTWDYSGRFALPAAEKLLANAEALANVIRDLHRHATEASQ